MENLSIVKDSETKVAKVTIERPKVLNALNESTIIELLGVFQQFSKDNDVLAVVLTGSGEKAFVAGADISELARLSPTEARQVAQKGQLMCDTISDLGKPVIAAINGFALGGGCELAMACTIRIACDTAKIGQPEINLGLIPGFGGTQRLPRFVGSGVALELLLKGDPISADEAFRIGLVNRVLTKEALINEAMSLATVLASKPPLSVRYILDAVRRGGQMSLADGCDYEASLFGLVAATEDKREGTQAFLEKRKAEFKGQ
tara:strand:+ start:9485 stop:10267 length:783 start_codon:yes stop_codon:yes gene_type:complete